ncbi:sarcosine oxidase subunit delta [Nostoc ellipsosporum NOK]|nr:sarcosine oxidase subunit delta [Nostoc ellipsosporum NOK]
MHSRKKKWWAHANGMSSWVSVTRATSATRFLSTIRLTIKRYTGDLFFLTCWIPYSGGRSTIFPLRYPYLRYSTARS